MEGTDVCFAPVLSLTEAPLHPHNVQRGPFVERDGVVQPAPAPRFSATPTEIQRPPSHAVQPPLVVLAACVFNSSRLPMLVPQFVVLALCVSLLLSLFFPLLFYILFFIF